mmetsp:Transcript_4485/g.13449  ORF Transcript_4485/g.13449 Transcript_4485/m.13449 type:complete len:118 (+) Transcript_4485:2655-3008(+)
MTCTAMSPKSKTVKTKSIAPPATQLSFCIKGQTKFQNPLESQFLGFQVLPSPGDIPLQARELFRFSQRQQCSIHKQANHCWREASFLSSRRIWRWGILCVHYDSPVYEGGQWGQVYS